MIGRKKSDVSNMRVLRAATELECLGRALSPPPGGVFSSLIKIIRLYRASRLAKNRFKCGQNNYCLEI